LASLIRNDFHIFRASLHRLGHSDIRVAQMTRCEALGREQRFSRGQRWFGTLL
jgi:hypothetical protein